jgi:hypothetical protein
MHSLQKYKKEKKIVNSKFEELYFRMPTNSIGKV